MKYITIQDLEFKGAEATLRPVDDAAMGIQYVKLLRLTFNGVRLYFYNPFGTSQVPLPNNAAPCGDIELGYCHFNDTPGEDACNFFAPSDRLWVHHNTWINCSEEGLDIAGGKGHIVEYNFVSGTTVNGIKIASQYSLVENLIFRGNVVLRGDMGNIN